MAQGKSRTQQLNGLPALAYVGVQPVSPVNFFIKQGAPTTNDYRNCYVGDMWLDNSSMYATPSTAPTAANLWVLVSIANKIGTWINLGGSGGIVISIVGGNNITITGTATNPIVNVSGTTNHSVQLGAANGALNSLENGTTGQVLQAVTGDDPIWATLAPSGATSFPTDSGTATPTTGVLNILAGLSTLNSGSSVFFTGSSNNVLLNVTDTNLNTIIGKGSGNLTLTSTNSTILGNLAAPALTSSPSNVIIGKSAATLLAGGSGSNTLIGTSVATALVSGSANIIIGETAGANLTGSESNCLLLADDGVAGKSGLIVISIPNQGDFIHNYPGVPASINGSNTFLGLDAGNFTMNVAAIGNIGIGSQAMGSMTTATGNTCVGESVGFRLTTGSSNVLIGRDAGQSSAGGTGLTTGTLNIAIGFTAGSAWTSSESSNIAIGTVGVAGESLTTRIGGFAGGEILQTKCFIQGIRSITSVNNNAIAVLVDSAGQLCTISSSRTKKDNIVDMGSYSDSIRSLRPVVFNYKEHSPESKSVGLIAEEVAEIAPQLVVYKDGEPETVKYQDLVPMLLNEFQKHCQLIGELQAINADLLNRIRLLEEYNLKKGV